MVKSEESSKVFAFSTFTIPGKVVIYIADTGCNIRMLKLILCVQLDIITAALNVGGTDRGSHGNCEQGEQNRQT